MDNNHLDAIAIATDAKRGEATLNKAYEFTGRFIAYPSEDAHVAHVLWCAHAHLMDRWENTPRLAFMSPEPGSGKSRALEITALLVPKPVLTVNASPAYLIRKVSSGDGVTILMDEVDTIFSNNNRSPEVESIRGLINAGHRKGATAGRCAIHGKDVVPEELNAYCATALAGLRDLPDTIATRSVIVRMRKRRAGENVEAYRARLIEPQAQAVRVALELWARSIHDDIAPLDDMPEGIEDRNGDVWESLLAVADAAGGDWPQRARKAAAALIAASNEREQSLGVKLLEDCRAAFGDAKSMPTELLLAKLIAMAESPWGDMRGRPLDARGLSKTLREYQIKPTQIRIGESTPRGYRREDFHDSWDRYLPPETASKTDEPGAAPKANNDAACFAVLDVLKSRGKAERDWCDHCGKPGADSAVSVNGTDFWVHADCIEPWRAAS